MLLKDFLISPGPTQVPQALLAAMAEPLYHHRTPRFSSVLTKTLDLLKRLYQTKNDVFILSSSGTGAMEASVVNTLSPGDKIIVARGGKFGERWGEIAAAYNLSPIYIDIPYGKSISPEQIKELLDKNKDIRAVFVQYCETSTGAMHPIKEISSLVSKTKALMVVDAITALGVVECPVDKWGIDIAVCGSQKSLMLPPGISFLSFSDKAWEASRKSSLPKYYFNLTKEKKAQKQKTTAWTPAITLIIGLKKALEMILDDEGMASVLKRHSMIADATRSGIAALGLELFATKPSNSVTSVRVPSDIDGAMIPKIMRDKYGVAIAGGQGTLKGKIFRLGHLGHIEKSDLAVAFQALEFTLRDIGYNFKWGASLEAIQEVLYKHYKDFPIRVS